MMLCARLLDSERTDSKRHCVLLSEQDADANLIMADNSCWVRKFIFLWAHGFCCAGRRMVNGPLCLGKDRE